MTEDNQSIQASGEKYTMKISRLTLDKLGIKMYDRVSAVLAELIANSYDADAKNVEVIAPFATKLESDGGKAAEMRENIEPQADLRQITEIRVVDTGIGMTSAQVNEYYLVVGLDRRRVRGERTASGRLVMGRKGIGKLAPFGICKEVEVISAGGEPNKNGEFEVADLILNLDAMMKDDDKPYHPGKGQHDGKFEKKTGTTIILRNFQPKKVPDMEILSRQLSARFGITRPDWKLILRNSKNEESIEVGQLNVSIMENTKIAVDDRPVPFEDTYLKVKGWVAYAQNPYKDETMAGIRVYCRSKIVSQTRDFGIMAGFTGEFKMRSYVVGEVYAEWIDEGEEDLITSDRQDILWSSPKGMAFQEWGIKLLKELARNAESTVSAKITTRFLEIARLEDLMKERNIADSLRNDIIRVTKALTKGIDPDKLKDDKFVSDMSDLAISLAPHKIIVDTLHDIGESNFDEIQEPLLTIVQLFNKTRMAEAYSLGQIAKERIDAISKLKRLISLGKDTPEDELQKLLESAPWLISPTWTVLSANETLTRFRENFEGWYKLTYGEEIVTTTMRDSKREPDFVMLSDDKDLFIVEIKKPNHSFINEEHERLMKYYRSLSEFIKGPTEGSNKSFGEMFDDPRIILVCDKVSLTGASQSTGFNAFVRDGTLIHKTWYNFLQDVENAHADFLEAQKKNQ